MNPTQPASGRPAAGASPPRPRAVTRSVALPKTRSEALALRELLEANLAALQALHEEHRRTLDASLGAEGGASPQLRRELRAIGSPGAPWVKALSETRALLFVALRELIAGAHEAELPLHPPRQDPADPDLHKR